MRKRRKRMLRKYGTGLETHFQARRIYESRLYRRQADVGKRYRKIMKTSTDDGVREKLKNTKKTKETTGKKEKEI